MKRVLVLAAVCLVFAARSTALADTSPASELTGSGDSWQEKTVRALENAASSAHKLGGLDPVYTAGVGEVPARAQVADGSADFAAAQDPLSAAELATAQSNGRSIAYVPFAEGAVGIVLGLQVDQQHGGALISNLKLTIPTLAKIFTHTIQYWNDAEIKAENPDVPNLDHLEVPQIIVVVRRDSSSSTAALIRAFLANPTAKVIWNTYATGNGAPADTPVDAWPADPVNSTIGTVSGSRGVIDNVLNLNPATGQPVPGTPPHNIGYVAPPFADEFHAPLVAVQNQAPAPHYVLPTLDAVASAVQSAGTYDAGTHRYAIDYSKVTDPAGYPIPMIAYFAVPTTGLPAAKASAMADFLDFVFTDAGKNEITQSGMVAMPGRAADEAAVAQQLRAAATTTTTSTTTASSMSSTTTSPTTAAVTAVSSSGDGFSSSSTSGGTDALPFTGGTLGGWLAVVAITGVFVGHAGRQWARRPRR